MRLDEFLGKGYKLEAGDEVMYQGENLSVYEDTVGNLNIPNEYDYSFHVTKSAQLEREKANPVESYDDFIESITLANLLNSHTQDFSQEKPTLSEWDNLIQVNHVSPDGTLGEPEFYIGRICGVDNSVEINNGSMTVWSGNSHNFVVKVVDAKLQIQ